MKLLKKPLNKDYATSDWSLDGELSHDQKIYAALDAWILITLFEQIQENKR